MVFKEATFSIQKGKEEGVHLDVTIFVNDHQPYHSLTAKHKVIRELVELINGRIELVKFSQVGRRITKGFDKGCRGGSRQRYLVLTEVLVNDINKIYH